MDECASDPAVASVGVHGSAGRNLFPSIRLEVDACESGRHGATG